MKQAEIVMGRVYLTKVGEALVKVRVTGDRIDYQGRKRFHCERLDNGKSLPKSRTAAALRPLPVI
jgi:hypothetical protein